jgi:hypothetical protein
MASATLAEPDISQEPSGGRAGGCWSQDLQGLALMRKMLRQAIAWIAQ